MTKQKDRPAAAGAANGVDGVDGVDARPAPPSRRGLLLVAMALLLAGLAVALIAILYRPDYVVLVPFDEPEERWFRTRIADFAEKRHVRLSTRAYKDEALRSAT